MRLPSLLRGVWSFCYPGACAACGSFIDGSNLLCVTCATQFDSLADAPACPLCGMPAASDGAPCAYCHGAGIAHYDRFCRLGVFEDPIKRLIHQMKYHGRWPLGEFLAARLAQTERGKGLLTEAQVVVPVPLHIRRHIQRGYNQADVIARGIAAHAHRGLKVLHAVRRIRDTETQTNLHSTESRRENVRGAFALRRAAKGMRDKHVIVVDDVSTTGSTLNAVAQVLKQAHPASLCAMVIAIADSRRRDFQAK